MTKVRKNYRFSEETVQRVKDLLEESEALFGYQLTETMLLEMLVHRQYLESFRRDK